MAKKKFISWPEAKKQGKARFTFQRVGKPAGRRVWGVYQVTSVSGELVGSFGGWEPASALKWACACLAWKHRSSVVVENTVDKEGGF